MTIRVAAAQMRVLDGDLEQNLRVARGFGPSFLSDHQGGQILEILLWLNSRRNGGSDRVDRGGRFRARLRQVGPSLLATAPQDKQVGRENDARKHRHSD